MRAQYSGGLLVLFALLGCDSRDAPTSVTAPTPVVPAAPVASPPPRNLALANWRGDATVLSRSGTAGCGWGTGVGEQREGVLWRVTITGESVLLDEDMSNWPTDHIAFSGTLNSQSFTARYDQGDDYARWVCQFREATLVGQFSPDLSTFEALETLVWGVPERETVVRRRWVASRM